MKITWKVRLCLVILVTIFFAALLFMSGRQRRVSVSVVPDIRTIASRSSDPKVSRLSHESYFSDVESCEADGNLSLGLEGKDLYVFYIYQICEQYYPELDPAIVQAVMETESQYIPTVESRCGAVGLMQVIPKWHAWRMEQYGLTDIWDPYTNIIVGMDFLNESYQRYGDYYKALLAYNNSSSYAKYVLELAKQFR